VDALSERQRQAVLDLHQANYHLADHPANLLKVGPRKSARSIIGPYKPAPRTLPLAASLSAIRKRLAA